LEDVARATGIISSLSSCLASSASSAISSQMSYPEGFENRLLVFKFSNIFIAITSLAHELLEVGRL
jgi:hypothetical protein